MNSSTIEKIKDFLSQDRTKDAIELMIESTKSESIRSSLIILLSRLKNLNSSKINGTISNAEKNIEENNIRESVLELLKSENQFPNFRPAKESNNNIFAIFYLLSIIIIIASIFVIHDSILEKNLDINNKIEKINNLYLRNGKIEEALAKYVEIQEEHSHSDSLNFISHILSIYCDSTKAIGDKFFELSKLRSGYPYDATLNLLLGNLSYFRGRDDDAVTYYNTTLLIDTSFAIAHLNRGISLQRLGYFSEALQSLKTANDLTENWNVSALSNIINLYYVFDRHEEVVLNAQRVSSIEEFFEPIFFMALSKRIQGEYSYSIALMDSLINRLDDPKFQENENKHFYFYNISNNGLIPIIIYITTIKDKQALLVANKALTYFILKEENEMNKFLDAFWNIEISETKKEEIAAFLYLYELPNLLKNKIISIEDVSKFTEILKDEILKSNNPNNELSKNKSK